MANIVSCVFGFDVLAYTASITTTGAVSIDVSASGNNASLGTDSLNIVSTCPLGYTLNIAGPTNNSLYLNGDSTSTSTISASTGTTSSPASILGNNLGTWGYTTASGATINSNFVGLTNTQTQLVSKASASASGGDSLTVSYGVSVTPTTTPGSYTLTESSQGANDDTITYYLVPNINCGSYVIRYNDNGANSTTTMGITHTVTENDEVTLVASNYQRAGYGFAGWSTVALNPDSANFQTDLATAKSAGKVFGPNETITANSALLSQAVIENSHQYITMYAIWVKPAQNATLQGWGGCDAMSTGDVIALTDTRDNQAYSVAKLADGNCWMIENMRLENTNSSDATKAQGFGGVFTGLANPETSNFYNTSTANSKYSTSNITGSNQIARFPRYNHTNTYSAVSDLNNTYITIEDIGDVDTEIINANVYSYGNYYTWAAAMANTSDLTTTSASESANTSICPTGWKLPYGNNTGNGNTSGGFYYLNYKVNNNSNVTNATASQKLRAYPNNFVFSGGIDDDFIFRGDHGFYWSTSSNNNMNSYATNINFTGVVPGTQGTNKGVGGPIRCLAAKGYTVTFNANGGSGTMNDQAIASGTPTALTPNAFTAPSNKVFGGWNTQANGSGTSYTDEEVVTDLAASGGNITLYAQWRTILYEHIASKTKGTQTAANLQATISASNSGVYTYDSSTFGTSSDASNSYTIYYYRGILDNTTGSYGSNGDGAAHPNYVRLGNTCWRIFRTTGSGGTKMIYNGTWTGSTCANAQTNAQISNTAFGSQAGSNQATNWVRNVHRAGYTYNASVDDSTTSTAVTTVLGNNSNYSTTNTTSTSIKTYLENTWFTGTNGISAYESILEPSAGYCNDRAVFSNEAGTTAITNIVPYAQSVAYFGAYTRHKVSNKLLTFGCSRGAVDIYSTSSASDGNKQLGKPVALITVDEAALSGNGYGNSTASNYNANSFLTTGTNYWTLSPRYRRSDGSLRIYSVGTNGAITGTTPSDTAGLRPVISLRYGTAASSGSGTATDPWIIDAP